MDELTDPSSMTWDEDLIRATLHSIDAERIFAIPGRRFCGMAPHKNFLFYYQISLFYRVEPPVSFSNYPGRWTRIIENKPGVGNTMEIICKVHIFLWNALHGA
jgi:hypothetical protein